MSQASAPIGFFALRIPAGAEPTLLDALHDVHITNICLVDPADDDDADEDQEKGEGKSAGAGGKQVNGKDKRKREAKAVVRLHRTFLPGFGADGFGLDDEEEEEESDEESDEQNGTAEEEEEASEQVKAAGGHDDDDDDDDDDEGDDEEEEEELEEESFAVCHLYPGRVDQATVSLHFTSDDLISFSVSGGWSIDLIGSYVSSPDGYDLSPDEESDEDDEDGWSEEEEEDEEIDSDLAGSLPDLKRRIGKKLGEEDDEDDDDDEDDSEFDLDSDDLAALMAEEDFESEEEEEEEEEEGAGRFTEVDVVEPASTTSKKQSKKRSLSEVDDSMDAEDQSLSTAVTAVAASGAGVTDEELRSAAQQAGLDGDLSKLSKNQRKRLNKKLKAAGQEEQQQDDADGERSVEIVTKTQLEPKVAKQTSVAPPAAAIKEAKSAAQSIKKTKLPSGLEIEDRKIGSGAPAKAGNRIGMRYIGKLLSGKTFDQNTSGKPFSFKLGRGEVIKGWDEGIKGIQVGGERRITIPPALAYGKRGAPPDIPPNATLVFDVKAVEIK